MTTKACATCNGGCGNGVAQKPTKDPVQKEMCRIMCKLRMRICTGKVKPDLGKKKINMSKLAEEEAANSKKLKSAISKKYGAGNKPSVAKKMLVPFDNAPWKGVKGARKALSPAKLTKALEPIKQQALNKAKKVMAGKLAKKAATAWMKFIPVVNVISTAYDVYDLATTGADLYKQIDSAFNKYKGDVYTAIPDLAVSGPDGELKDMYDFKFDGDRWRGNGQKELYNKALADSGSGKKVKTVSPESCGCDGMLKISSQKIQAVAEAVDGTE